MARPSADLRILDPRPTLQGSGDPNSLQNLIVDQLPNGAVCYVNGEADWFVLDKFDVSAASPPNVIVTGRGASKPGRWHRYNGVGITAQYVPTIAYLRAHPSIINMGASFLLSHTTPGDGGFGDFYWDAASTAADNNGTIVQVTGVATGRWKRQILDVIWVMWFGCSTAGSKASNASAIDATIAAAAAYQSGAVVGFGPGVFYTNKVHDVPENVSIEGQGPDQTWLRGWSGSDVMNAAGFRWLDPTFMLQGSNLVCSGMSIVSAANNASAVEVMAASNGLNIMQPRIEKLSIYLYGSNQVGIKLSATGAGAFIQKPLVDDCYCQGNATTIGLRLQSVIGGRVSVGRYTLHDVGISMQDALAITIEGTSLDGCTHALVKGTGGVDGINIDHPNWEPQSGDPNFYHFDFNGATGRGTWDLGSASGYDAGHLLRPPSGMGILLGPDGAAGYDNAVDVWGFDTSATGFSGKRWDGPVRTRREPITISLANTLIDPLAINRRPILDLTATLSGSVAGFHTVAAHNYADLEIILTAAGVIDVPILHMSGAAAVGEKIETPDGQTLYLRAATSGESPGWCMLRYNTTSNVWQIVENNNNVLLPYNGEWQSYFDADDFSLQDLVTPPTQWLAKQGNANTPDIWGINGAVSVSRTATAKGKSLLIASGAYLRCDAMGIRLWNGNTNDVAVHWHVKSNSVVGVQEALSVTNNATNSLMRYFANSAVSNLNVSQVASPGSVTGVATADEYVLSATLIGQTLQLWKNGVSVGTLATGVRSNSTVVQTCFGVYGGDRASNPANMYVRRIAVGLPATFSAAALTSKWLNR